jgi:DNA-directed RNA polymerase subunit M/transcription elongation factor TFIIS
MPCSICDGETRVADHTAETIEGIPLRLAHTLCPACGHARIIYFQLRSALPN